MNDMKHELQSIPFKLFTHQEKSIYEKRSLFLLKKLLS